MSELALAQGRPKKVLELGSGSGYQTAILASLVDEICAIERIKPLLERARSSYARCECATCDCGMAMAGRMGQRGTFDLILGAAAPERPAYPVAGTARARRQADPARRWRTVSNS